MIAAVCTISGQCSLRISLTRYHSHSGHLRNGSLVALPLSGKPGLPSLPAPIALSYAGLMVCDPLFVFCVFVCVYLFWDAGGWG